MWIKEEVVGSDFHLGPAMATALVVAVVGSVLFGVYPQPVFDQAIAAAQTLGGVADLALR